MYFYVYLKRRVRCIVFERFRLVSSDSRRWVRWGRSGGARLFLELVILVMWSRGLSFCVFFIIMSIDASEGIVWL